MKNYLLAYNATAFVCWLAYFVSFTSADFQLNNTNVILLAVAQGMAFLEIVHAVLKWVKSPVGSTTAQVFSRLLVLVLILLFYYRFNINPVCYAGIVTVSFAWSITELVRYSFYFFQLQGKQPEALLWMRYSFFIVLYPIGVTGEWLVMGSPLFGGLFSLWLYFAVAIPVAVSYMYYFPVLYKYMWKQRREKLG